jgi:hypothetical protein
MDPETSRCTDRLALLFKGDGLPPIAGRIFGLLLLSDDAEDLAVSKASASTNARLGRWQRFTEAIGEGRRTLPLARR